MQLTVSITLEEPLVLPINYNHIVQSIIYRALGIMPDYVDFLHGCGYTRGKRQYKMFQFSQLNGDYVVQSRQIIFQSYVNFEIRSPEPLLINLLADSFEHRGITFGETVCRDIELELYDYTVEDMDLLIRMKSPVTVYSTNPVTKKTYYYSPDESEFFRKVEENFIRKYEAFYGIPPYSTINLSHVGGEQPRKLVTRYQGNYINAWYGTYRLEGKRKYLDFFVSGRIRRKEFTGIWDVSIVVAARQIIGSKKSVNLGYIFTKNRKA